jgi:hypothetical protein
VEEVSLPIACIGHGPSFALPNVTLLTRTLLCQGYVQFFVRLSKPNLGAYIWTLNLGDVWLDVDLRMDTKRNVFEMI